MNLLLLKDDISSLNLSKGDITIRISSSNIAIHEVEEAGKERLLNYHDHQGKWMQPLQQIFQEPVEWLLKEKMKSNKPLHIIEAIAREPEAPGAIEKALKTSNEYYRKFVDPDFTGLYGGNIECSISIDTLYSKIEIKGKTASTHLYLLELNGLKRLISVSGDFKGQKFWKGFLFLIKEVSSDNHWEFEITGLIYDHWGTEFKICPLKDIDEFYQCLNWK